MKKDRFCGLFPSHRGSMPAVLLFAFFLPQFKLPLLFRVPLLTGAGFAFQLALLPDYLPGRVFIFALLS